MLHRAQKTLPDGAGRTGKRDVVRKDRLHAALVSLNPNLPSPAIEQTLAINTGSRNAMSAVAANQEACEQIRNGVDTARQMNSQD